MTMKKYILGTLALAAIAFPSASYAATFAYVNMDGEVRTVEADTPTTALQTAPNLHVHSGVMLLDSADDTDVVGDDVPGT